jgi:hypothetical protein
LFEEVAERIFFFPLSLFWVRVRWALFDKEVPIVKSYPTLNIDKKMPQNIKNL